MRQVLLCLLRRTSVGGQLLGLYLYDAFRLQRIPARRKGVRKINAALGELLPDALLRDVEVLGLCLHASGGIER